MTSERKNVKSPAEEHSLLSNAGEECVRECVDTRRNTVLQYGVASWNWVFRSEQGISRELLSAAVHWTRKHIVECTGGEDRGTAYGEPTSVGFFTFAFLHTAVLTAFPLYLIEISNRNFLGVTHRTFRVMCT